MKTEAPKKGLQKLTELEVKINSIFALQQITQNDINAIKDKTEIDLFNKRFTERLNSLKDEERDNFLKKFDN